jgi:ABC-type nitrate/sulfonate/bicarbonate transport system substrate-binding protein/outer membrane protein OmpA-like peptidoglycan-associated protein
MKKMLLLLTCLTLMASLPLLAAPKTVRFEAMKKELAGTPVRDFRAGSTLKLPLITWGGDIATILANGDARKTRQGSIFDKAGLSFELVREDVFANQVKAYMKGESPYLRGTLGMINMASELLSADPRTKPVVIYQLTWSAGGDALAVNGKIRTAADLKGKTIGVQAYGPHVYYMSRLLADAGLSLKDVKLKWYPDLTGTDNTPMAAMQAGEVDAAFAITPDAMLLTSGGTVGTGAEGSVRGARILLSTRTANRVISDVYVVRSDYFSKHRKQVEAFVGGLMQGAEKLRQLAVGKGSAAYKKTFTAAAELLLDSPLALADAEGLYGDCQFVEWKGNVDFFANPNYPRSLERLSAEIQTSLTGLGLLSGQVALSQAGWDYSRFKQGLRFAERSESPRFDTAQVSSVIARKQQQGTLQEGELFSFEIFFEPNQNTFSADLYQGSFDKVIAFSATYGGALITVEGNSDPLGYLRKKKSGESSIVLGRVKQAAKNLSLSRAMAVRDSITQYAAQKGITLDPSQFAVVGHGITKPKNGVCGQDPCAPKTEKEWRDNMRVEFRILQVEAESSVFNPL